MLRAYCHYIDTVFILQNFLAASCGNKKAGDEGHLVQQSSKLGQSFYKVALPFLSASLLTVGLLKYVNQKMSVSRWVFLRLKTIYLSICYGNLGNQI